MRSWRLDTAPAQGQLDLSRVTGLVSSIGSDDSNALAGAILKLLGGIAAISQCTIFAYEFGNRPRTVSVADHRGGRFLRDVADTYARHFYALDGNQKIVSSARSDTSRATLMLHRQTSDDIANEAYRAECYQRPNVSDRLSLLVQPMADLWLSVNLYRDRRFGNFHPHEIALIETMAPLIAHAAKNHYAICGQRDMPVSHLMLARIRALCPDLSKRELDVIAGVLEGRTAQEISDAMGIKATSVATYQKRAYRRLGVSSQRQLFALCIGNGKA